MPRKRKPYLEGDWFELNVPGVGTAIGIIARASPRSVLGGYFFGPIERPITASSFRDLRKEDAILVCRFGDVGIVDGEWPLIGRTEHWGRSKWNLPAFSYLDAVDPDLAFARLYDDANPNSIPEQWAISVDDALLMPIDGMLGHRVVEAWLSKLLRGETIPRPLAPRKTTEGNGPRTAERRH